MSNPDTIAIIADKLVRTHIEAGCSESLMIQSAPRLLSTRTSSFVKLPPATRKALAHQYEHRAMQLLYGTRTDMSTTRRYW